MPKLRNMMARVHGLSVCRTKLSNVFERAMKKLGLSVLSGLVVTFGTAILGAPAAQSSVVTFDIRGQATYAGDNSIQSFSGSLGVDTAAGTVTALSIQIPFFSGFTTAGMSLAPAHLAEIFYSPDYVVGSGYSTSIPSPPFPFLGCGIFGCAQTDNASILIQFTTTTGSLVGFNGGIIDSGEVFDVKITTGGHDEIGFGYSNLSGTISAVPESSTWAMMILGFAGLGVVAYRRRAGFALGAI